MNNETFDYGGKKLNLDVNNLNPEDYNKNQSKTMKSDDDRLLGLCFSIGDQYFKIKYINVQKKRISAIWYNTRTEQFHGLPELGTTCTIFGKIYQVTYQNKLCNRINIEPI